MSFVSVFININNSGTRIFLEKNMMGSLTDGCLQARSIAEGLKVKLLVQKGISFVDALLDLFCGAYDMRDIRTFEDESDSFDSFWTVFQHSFFCGGLITLNIFVIVLPFYDF